MYMSSSKLMVEFGATTRIHLKIIYDDNDKEEFKFLVNSEL